MFIKKSKNLIINTSDDLMIATSTLEKISQQMGWMDEESLKPLLALLDAPFKIRQGTGESIDAAFENLISKLDANQNYHMVMLVFAGEIGSYSITDMDDIISQFMNEYITQDVSFISITAEDEQPIMSITMIY